MLQVLSRIHERANGEFDSLFTRRRLFELLALSLLAVVAARAMMQGIDVRQFYNGDTLFPVHVFQYGLFDYRSPPSNNFFPDLLTHGILNPFITDPLTQKLVAGSLLVLVMSFAFAVLRGFEHQVVLLSVLSFSGFYYFDTTAHFALPLCMLLYVCARQDWLQYAVLFLIVFSDLLILIPLAVYLFSYGSDRRNLTTWLLIAVAIALNLIYSDFITQGPKVVPVAAGFALLTAVAVRMGLVRMAILTIAIALIALVATEVIAGRYGLSVAASLLVFALPNTGTGIDWRAIALPIAIVAFFFLGLDKREHQKLDDSYACLVDELDRRDIKSIATEHWTSRPLYFALMRDGAGPMPDITQIDFGTGQSHVWMAPYAFQGSPTNWAILNHFSCPYYANDALHCGQLKLGQVKERVPVCNSTFELVRYQDPLPAKQPSLPTSRLAWSYFHLQIILNRLRGKVNDRFGLAL